METAKHKAAKVAYRAAVDAASAKSLDLKKAEAWNKAAAAAIQAEYYALVKIRDAADKALTLARMENELEDALADGKVTPEQEAKARAYLAVHA